ncbi:MAG: valine--tRNA ligase [Planctomycetota bacterium]|nr:valine--tRNA ligase [Planctomycetota bacterium]
MDSHAFHADPKKVLEGPPERRAPAYCVLIPPPNVTARLHLGHALNNTLQDVLVRAHRMRGFEALWMPGTDHAGIATQAVVERRLWEERKLRRHDFKREDFVAKVQEFKDEYEAAITDQLKQMGCSCDWDRQRFTMDSVCARAVQEAFFRLFQDGLIYRGKRLVNWDPVLQTAVADDECFDEDVDSSFWYLRYPLVRKPGEPHADAQPVTWDELASRGYQGAEEHRGDEQAWVIVATTRPETYLGDSAVAVNPHDPRAASLRGLFVELPLVGRVIPIIEDSYVVLPEAMARTEEEKADPKAKFATGFLKVTPAHDPNDYEIYQRHKPVMDAAQGGEGRALINVMAPDATISDKHGWTDVGGAHLFVGLSREDARKKVVAAFKSHAIQGGSASLLEGIKPHRHSVKHSDRSKAIIEPYLSDQWYVKVTDHRLAQAANNALVPEQRSQGRQQTGAGKSSSTDEQMRFFPARYAKTFEQWHDNIRDWCISRQLWWGHRVPVWSRDFSGVPATFKDSVSQGLAMGTLQLKLDEWAEEGKVCCRDFISRPGSASLTISAMLERHAAHAGPAPFFVCLRIDDPGIIAFLESHGFTRDSDVLDTWFSSALWPLSTMGWPDAASSEALAAKDNKPCDFRGVLEAFNPTSSLSTAREIITLWVSRMTMFNRYFLPESWPGHRPESREESADSVRARIFGAKASDAGADRDANAPMGQGRGPVPFRDVFIHAVIQDGQGQKMSKSLGNGVDPLDIIETHGADAMRFTLCSMATQTQDVRMPVDLICPHTGVTFPPRMITNRTGDVVPAPIQDSPKDPARKMVTTYGVVSGEAKPSPDMPLAKNTSSKFDLGRNFCNKLWNASRLSMTILAAPASGGPSPAGALAPASLGLESRWILSRLHAGAAKVDEALANYEFSVYAQAMYELVWNDLCDWYLESIKPHAAESPGARATLRTALEIVLRLLHPIAPFVTEAIWARLATLPVPPIQGVELVGPRKARTLCTAGWPVLGASLRDQAAEREYGRMQALVTAIREVRAQHNVPPKRKVKLHAPAGSAPLPPELMHLSCTHAGLSSITSTPAQGASVAFGFEASEFRLSDLADHVDAGAERERLEKQIAELTKTIATLEGRLANPSYADKAPPKLVQQTRDQLTRAQGDLATAQSALASLPA